MIIWENESPADVVIRAMKEYADQCRRDLEDARVRVDATYQALTRAEAAYREAIREQKRRENDGKRD